MLGHPADRMRVGDVLRALEGELSLVEDDPESAPKMDTLSRCIRKMVWEPVDLSINRLVDRITLEELAEEKRAIDGLMEPMYHI